MAVYETTYRNYEGPRTPRWQRFLVIARYAKEKVFQTRFVTALFALSFAVPLGSAVLIYLHHNAGALDLMGVSPQDILPIDAEFFHVWLWIQGVSAFLLTVLVAPGLVAPDLAHHGLPLYLARPFSRAEYVAGKMTVLVGLLSLVTWVPGLLLFFYQMQLVGPEWTAEFGHVGLAIFLSAWIWILVLSLLALALSAWMKWRTVAAGALFVVFFIGQALAEVINNVFHTHWGSLLNLGEMIQTVWAGLFFDTVSRDVPLWSAWAALLALCAICLWMLHRKLQAYEVVQ